MFYNYNGTFKITKQYFTYFTFDMYIILYNV